MNARLRDRAARRAVTSGARRPYPFLLEFRRRAAPAAECRNNFDAVCVPWVFSGDGNRYVRVLLVPSPCTQGEG